jgi:hypothetical protein
VTALFGAIEGSRAALAALRENGHPNQSPKVAYADYAQVVDLAGHQGFAHDFEG